MLTDDQRRRLVDVARRSVAARVSGGRHTPGGPLDLPAASGVFVTLKLGGQLRGCLGTVDWLEDLASEVARCAANAASVDPRFPAVTTNELVDVTVEISVLGPLERIHPQMTGAPGSMTIGVHGLVVERGRHRGLLLPQVAAERQWSPEEFLRQTSVKASLAPESWERDAIVYRFTADVFGE
jgi:AmmeMemoRadiSam system protein A